MKIVTLASDMYNPIDRWLYFINARDTARRNKAIGLPKPWCNDAIIQQYRFCNVRRMDDKVSQWLLKHWYRPNYGHHNMLVACSLARFFNLPESLAGITDHVFKFKVDIEGIRQWMKGRKLNGLNCFNGAYMVRGVEAMDKADMVLDMIVKPILAKPPSINAKSMQKAVEAFIPYWGFSAFMAGQVVADLRWALGGQWLDRHTWAAVGPGSSRGLNRILKQPLNQKVHQERFNVELTRLIEIGKQSLPNAITARLEAIDWQNTLCEFDKYERALHGEGTPKQRYAGV